MLNNTIERLRAMKMNAFASELERQIEDSESIISLDSRTDLHFLLIVNGIADRTISLSDLSEMPDSLMLLLQ